jgi:hypothetical protein
MPTQKHPAPRVPPVLAPRFRTLIQHQHHHTPSEHYRTLTPAQKLAQTIATKTPYTKIPSPNITQKTKIMFEK